MGQELLCLLPSSSLLSHQVLYSITWRYALLPPLFQAYCPHLPSSHTRSSTQSPGATPSSHPSSKPIALIFPPLTPGPLLNHLALRPPPTPLPSLLPSSSLLSHQVLYSITWRYALLPPLFQAYCPHLPSSHTRSSTQSPGATPSSHPSSKPIALIFPPLTPGPLLNHLALRPPPTPLPSLLPSSSLLSHQVLYSITWRYALLPPLFQAETMGTLNDLCAYCPHLPSSHTRSSTQSPGATPSSHPSSKPIALIFPPLTPGPLLNHLALRPPPTPLPSLLPSSSLLSHQVLYSITWRYALLPPLFQAYCPHLPSSHTRSSTQSPGATPSSHPSSKPIALIFPPLTPGPLLNHLALRPPPTPLPSLLPSSSLLSHQVLYSITWRYALLPPLFQAYCPHLPSSHTRSSTQSPGATPSSHPSSKPKLWVH